MLKENLKAYKDSKAYNEESVIDILSDVIDHCCDEEVADKALMKIHELVVGNHFNEEFADKAVHNFFHIDKSGDKIYGPFITKDQAKEYYNKYSRSLTTENNFYDFYVALNKVMSDHKKLLQEWFDDDQVVDKCVELTLSCINDDDYSCNGCKIWNYIKQDYL